MNSPNVRKDHSFNTPITYFLVVILISVGIGISCQTPTKKTKASKAMRLEGYMNHEITMLRNPATETIPEGSFEAERAQAREILERQRLEGRPLVNSYSFQGPENLGGRTRSVVYDKRFNGTTNRIILAGGVSGGVYKSVDDGATWTRKSPLGDHFSCTSIAQDTRAGFEDTWFYTVGEASGNSAGAQGASYSGNGVYKSTDNGETWARLTASNTTPLETFSTAADYITKVIVHPVSGHVYIASLATIMRSTDGGTTWGTVLSGPLSSSSQQTDIVVAATGRLYAAFGGTNDSSVDGVWASPPGPMSGDLGTWTQIAGAGAGGSPTGWNAEPAYGRVVLAIAPSDEKFLYALYFSGGSPPCPGAAKEAELFRWDDTMGTWTELSAGLPDEPGCLGGNDPFAVQGGYDLVIAVKPDSASTLFLGGTNAYRSTDAGVSWTRIGGYGAPRAHSPFADSHPDIHSFAFSPISSTTMICGNDGGVQRTTANLAPVVAWSQINIGYRTYQYFHVTLDPRSGNSKVMGGAQDNGTTRNVGGTGTTFEGIFGGDGVSVGLSDLIGGVQYEYVGFQAGGIQRRPSTDPSGFATDIMPISEPGVSSGLFVTLFKLDADNSEILYYANDEVLYRTLSASTVDPSTWTTMTGVAAAVSSARKITAISPSRGTYAPATSSLFIGASDTTSPLTTAPKVFRLDDPAGVPAGTGPVDISSASFPVGAFVSSIAVHPTSDDTVIVTFSNYGVSSIWITTTANSVAPTWTEIEGTLSLPSVRSSAISVKGATTEYFVGTSTGLYMTTTIAGAGTTWTQEASGEIGNAVVASLALRPVDNKLLVGTHGYGMWYTAPPSSAAVTIGGRVVSSGGSGIGNTIVRLASPEGGVRSVRTSSFGYFSFDDVTVGATYSLTAQSKRYTFEAQTVTVTDAISNLEIVGK